MATREDPIHRADRSSAHALVTIGRELRQARMAAGTSQTFVGRKVGIAHTQVSRIERAEVSGTSVQVLCRLCACVGLDLTVRAYPGGDALRDTAQRRVLERFWPHLHPSLGWRTEVPLPQPGDRRA